jgi:hypothetical protein
MAKSTELVVPLPNTDSKYKRPQEKRSLSCGYAGEIDQQRVVNARAREQGRVSRNGCGSIPAVFNLGYAKTTYINQIETHLTEPLEP